MWFPEPTKVVHFPAGPALNSGHSSFPPERAVADLNGVSCEIAVSVAEGGLHSVRRLEVAMPELIDLFRTFGRGVAVGSHGPVSGKPFRAEYEETHTRRSTEEVARCWGSLARDASGRIRQDIFTPDPHDPSAARHVTAIWDSVAGTYCLIDQDTGDLQELELGRMIRDHFPGSGPAACPVPDTPQPTRTRPAANQRELLGEKSIQHIPCVGLRYTDGSRHETTEEWLSKDLHINVLVVTKSEDIEIVYRVFNVQLSEPEAGLFVPPTERTPR